MLPVITDILNKYQEQLTSAVPDELERFQVLRCCQVSFLNILLDAKVRGLLNHVLPFITSKVPEGHHADLQDAYNMFLSGLGLATIPAAMAALAGDINPEMQRINNSGEAIIHILACSHADEHFAKHGK